MIEQGQVAIKLMIVMILGRIGKRLEVKGVRKGIGQEGLDHDLKAKGEVEINEEEVQVTILTLVRTQGDEKVAEVKDQGHTQEVLRVRVAVTQVVLLVLFIGKGEEREKRFRIKTD